MISHNSVCLNQNHHDTSVFFVLWLNLNLRCSCVSSLLVYSCFVFAATVPFHGAASVAEPEAIRRFLEDPFAAWKLPAETLLKKGEEFRIPQFCHATLCVDEKRCRIKSQALKGIKHNSMTGLQQKYLFNWSWALSTQVFCPYALRVSHVFKEFGICRRPYYTSTSAAVHSTDLGAFAWEVPTSRDAQVKFFSSPK